MLGDNLENELGASVHVHTHRCACTTHLRAHTCAQTTDTNTLLIGLFIHLPGLAGRKGRLRTARLNTRRTTCLNAGGALAHTILNFGLWGFLPHCKACLFSLCHTPHSHAHSHARFLPRGHSIAMLMDSSLPTHILETHSFIHCHLESFSCIKHYILLLKITSNVKVAPIASAPAVRRNC